MRDGYGRRIDYVRVSVTDRCNLRCRYCMPAEGVPKRRHADILSFEEIVRACRALAELGVGRIKLTGGEPLARRGVADLAGLLKGIPGVASVTLTTNGTLLPGLAGDLRRAGLDGVNVSLDTLDPGRYRFMTRGGEAALALAGIEAALAAGFPAVKINCVPLAGAGEEDAVAIAGLARERPLHVRFIEMMPIGAGAAFAPPGRERLRAALRRAFGELSPCSEALGNGPAEYWSLPGFAGRIGFIDTLDHGICRRCNRVRLTADGVLKTCLHMDRGVDVRPLLREGCSGELRECLVRAVAAKPPHHEFAAGTVAERRKMSQIGG